MKLTLGNYHFFNTVHKQKFWYFKKNLKKKFRTKLSIFDGLKINQDWHLHSSVCIKVFLKIPSFCQLQSLKVWILSKTSFRPAGTLLGIGWMIISFEFHFWNFFQIPFHHLKVLLYYVIEDNENFCLLLPAKLAIKV